MARLHYSMIERKLHRCTYGYNLKCKKYIAENIIGSDLHQSRIEVTQ